MTTIKHRYQLLEKISENQVATIHKGFDKKKERNIIIKIVSRSHILIATGKCFNEISIFECEYLL